MKMVLFSAGNGRKQNEVILVGDVDDIRALRDSVGVEFEVTFTPTTDFAIDEVVDYHPVYGEPECRRTKIKDGPFIVCGTLCWKVEGISGTVADRNLAKVA